MKKIVPLVALAAVAVAGAAYGTSAASASQTSVTTRDHPTPATLVLNYTAKGATLRAFAGEQIFLTLPSHADGGYEWSLVSTGGLDFHGHNYSPPTSDMPGAAGKDMFSFVALEPGHDRLLLVDKRPWTGGGVAEQFSVTIDVS